MEVNEVEEIIRNVIEQNKLKKGLFRHTTQIESIELKNTIVQEDGFLTSDETGIASLQLNLKKTGEFLKIIYNFQSDGNEGEVNIVTKGEDKQEKYPLGRFYGESIVYFLKNSFDVKSLLIEVTTSSAFKVAQLEVISISYSEYKFNKLKQYSQKLSSLISKQPHLKKKFIAQLRTDGLRKTLQKTQQKLHQANESHNNIQIISGVPNIHSIEHNNSILFVCHDAQNAGASILSLNLVKTLHETFNKDVVVFLLKGGPLEKEFLKYSTVINFNQSSLSYLENQNEVERIVKEFKQKGFDFCISNSIVSNILTKVLYDHDIKVISLIHELPTSIFTYNFLEAAKYVCNYSDKIVFPNEFVKKSFKEKFDFKEERAVVRPQGIYKKRTLEINKEAAKIELCKTLGISERSIILLGGGYGDIRKGFDLFFSLASNILKDDQKKEYHFVWAGEVETVLGNWMQHDSRVLGVESHIHLMGFQSDLLPILQGADIFLLPSREDPFPSIALEAIDNGTPTVTFAESGGMAEFIQKIGVVPSKYLDIEDMKQEIYRIIGDNNLYNSLSQVGRELIEKEFGFSDYVHDLLKMREKAQPKNEYRISVIIPNYNYENYLEERLKSIIYQTIQPAEIIFLDDLSTDGSISVAERILSNSNIPYRIIKNEKNVGCFGQWIKGIKEATGDLIWIAEADDVCKLDTLEQLTKFFEDDEVNLAYCQSEIIDSNSKKVGFIYNEYTNDLSSTKWESSYILDGKQEVVQGLGIKNTIPNASAVLFRATALVGIEKELTNYKIGGDWLAYLYTLKVGRIAFCPLTLNYHRRHSSSIVSRNEQKVEYYQEMIAIKKYILQNFEIPQFLVPKFLEHVSNEYKRLGCKGYDSTNILDNNIISGLYQDLIDMTETKVTSSNYLQNSKNILFVAPDFEVGGGQMLVIRLANFFSVSQKVYIYNARPWLTTDPVIAKMISEAVTVLDSTGNPDELKELITELDIDVVNSHIWWSDKISYRALKGNQKVKWILSMHGCYEGLKANPDWDGEFANLVSPMLNTADHVIYATNKNLEIFDVVKLEDSSKLHKIYYGYELQSIPPKNREELGMKQGEFLFGLVSRAIKEKGWEESIKAIIELNEKEESNAHLALIGQSEYANKLKEKYKDYKYIHFIMNLKKPSEWIGWVKVFNAALLPSYFISESLPNSIIEYLAYNKPVISTRIGEIPEMLYSEKNEKYAGILLDLNLNREVDVEDLVVAMRTIVSDRIAFENYSNNTELLFEQFSMKTFGSKYYELFL